MRELTQIEKQVLLLLSPLFCAYTTARITEETMQVYAVALADVDKGALSGAIMKCIRTKKFFPSIAEIREEADLLQSISTGTMIKSPDEAWGEVLRQMEEAFIYKKPVFSTPEIEQAALAMGWRGLCETPVDVIGVARGQFLKLYESTCKRRKESKVNNAVLQLVGKVSSKKQIGAATKSLRESVS